MNKLMNGIIRMVFFSLCFLFNCHQKWLLVFYSIFNFQWIPVNIYWCRWLLKRKRIYRHHKHTQTPDHLLINVVVVSFLFIFLVYDVRIQEKRKLFLFSDARMQYLMISIHKNRYLLLIGVCTNEWRTHSQYNTI